MSAFRFVQNSVGYAVLDRDSGVQLGSVVRRSRHEDRARPITWRWWEARLGYRTLKDGGGQVTAKYDTREAAARALAEARSTG